MIFIYFFGGESFLLYIQRYKKIYKKQKMEENGEKPGFDFKNLIIGGLIIFCIWIYFNPFNSDKISSLEKDNRDKENEIKKIGWQRDTLLLKRIMIDNELKDLKKLSELRSDTIDIYKKVSKSKDYEIKELKKDLKFYNDMLSEQEKKIDELEKNPIILPKNKIIEKISEKL